jgi:hypothetical protein
MFVFKKATMSVTESNIVIIRISDNVELDVEDVKEMFAKRLEVIGENPYAIINISGKHSGITSEARKLAAEPQYALYRQAFAMVVNSLAQRIIGNFYIKFDSPPSPARVFNDEKAAFEWVKTFEGIGKKESSDTYSTNSR